MDIVYAIFDTEGNHLVALYNNYQAAVGHLAQALAHKQQVEIQTWHVHSQTLPESQ